VNQPRPGTGRHDLVSLPSWDLTPEQLAGFELLARGAYAPLTGYMTHFEAAACADPEASSTPPWPAPVTLAVPRALAARLASDPARLVLRDPEGVPLGVLQVTEALPTDDDEESWTLAGPIEAVQRPRHHDFAALRPTASELGEARRDSGRARRLVLFADTFLHVPLLADAQAAARSLDAELLIAGLMRQARHDDESYVDLVRAWRAAVGTDEGTRLCLLPWVHRDDPGAELRVRAAVARNLGGTHVVVAAGTPLPHGLAIPAVAVDDHAAARTEIEERLRTGDALPPSLLAPAVAAELARARPAPARRGYAVFLTGLSGSGKSTVASILRARLLEIERRRVTLLDGDVVRKHLSSELGFSREHRELNVLRIAYVASEIVKNGGAAICAPIAPYDTVRREARRLVSAHGDFILVHVATPLEECERRDPKGLYAKARAGLLPGFTGISDPYEPPGDAEIVIDTLADPAPAAAGRILAFLRQRGYIA
jgi:sulfate adenylyltransferase